MKVLSTTTSLISKGSISLFAMSFLFVFSAFLPQGSTLLAQNSATLNQRVEYGDNKVKLLGLSNREGLQEAPFNEWFDKNYKAYEPKAEVIKKAKKKMKGVEVKAFLGTWCGDSKREVPKFYKVLDAMKFDESRLELISLDRESGVYKQSPTSEEKGLNIHRVPTFVFFKDGEEIGRIVEYPVTSMEVDIAQIVNGLASTPNYPLVGRLHNILEKEGVAYFEGKEKPWANFIGSFTKGSRVLNAYGYVLLDQGKTEEAIFILKLNANAYSHVPNVWDSLAEAYLRAGQKDLAVENYEKVLSMEPDNETAKKAIAMISEQ